MSYKIFQVKNCIVKLIQENNLLDMKTFLGELSNK